MARCDGNMRVCFNSSDGFFPTPVSTKTQLSELAVEGLSQLSEELDEGSGFFLAAPFGAALSSFSPASFAVFLCPSSLAQAPLLSGRPKRLTIRSSGDPASFRAPLASSKTPSPCLAKS